MRGRVKWFSNQKGYGFITCEDNKDVFVHFRSILADGYRSLKENQEVEFDVEEGPKGKQAVKVKVVNNG